MKSPFLYHTQRGGLTSRLEFIWVVVASGLFVALASRTLAPSLAFSSPLALLSCWSLLRLNFRSALLLSFILSSSLDGLYGQGGSLIIPCHLFATLLGRWTQPPINLPFIWILPIQIALWSFFYDTSWQLLSSMSVHSFPPMNQLYQLPLLALKDGALAFFCVTLPLLILPRSQPTHVT